MVLREGFLGSSYSAVNYSDSAISVISSFLNENICETGYGFEKDITYMVQQLQEYLLYIDKRIIRAER